MYITLFSQCPWVYLSTPVSYQPLIIFFLFYIINATLQYSLGAVLSRVLCAACCHPLLPRLCLFSFVCPSGEISCLS